MIKTKWIFIKQEGDFKLYIRQPGYKTLFCSPDSYWKDIDTGENCGQMVSLAYFLYNNNGTINEDCEVEPNHYKLIRKEE